MDMLRAEPRMGSRTGPSSQGPLSASRGATSQTSFLPEGSLSSLSGQPAVDWARLPIPKANQMADSGYYRSETPSEAGTPSPEPPSAYSVALVSAKELWRVGLVVCPV